MEVYVKTVANEGDLVFILNREAREAFLIIGNDPVIGCHYEDVETIVSTSSLTQLNPKGVLTAEIVSVVKMSRMGTRSNRKRRVPLRVKRACSRNIS